jgi:hypothetical protein
VQADDNGGAAQRWKPAQVALPDLTSDDYTFRNEFDRYLKIPAGSTAAGAQGSTEPEASRRPVTRLPDYRGAVHHSPPVDGAGLLDGRHHEFRYLPERCHPDQWMCEPPLTS